MFILNARSVARFAGSGFFGDSIPGLRSLRSLTRGYHLPPLRGSLPPSAWKL
jgi:hypothetical protein